MHYEDLVITELKISGDYWYANLISKNGYYFSFPVASANTTELELTKNRIIIGKKFLGVIQNDKLVALDGFSFIESKSKSK